MRKRQQGNILRPCLVRIISVWHLKNSFHILLLSKVTVIPLHVDSAGKLHSWLLVLVAAIADKDMDDTLLRLATHEPRVGLAKGLASVLANRVCLSCIPPAGCSWLTTTKSEQADVWGTVDVVVPSWRSTIMAWLCGMAMWLRKSSEELLSLLPQVTSDLSTSSESWTSHISQQGRRGGRAARARRPVSVEWRVNQKRGWTANHAVESACSVLQ